MGILDDYAVRKDVATIGGTIQKTPTNPSDIVNKSYCDTKLDTVAFNDLTDYPLDAAGVLTNDGVGNLSWDTGGSSQTPWLSNIDADGYDLTDLGNINLRTSTSLVGQIKINSVPYFHNYGTYNLWLANAGNFTLTGTYNIGIGDTALDSLTNGGYNVAIGKNALTAQTTGNQNIGIGRFAGGTLTTTSQSVFIGDSAGRYITGESNIGIGFQAVMGAEGSSGQSNVGIGGNALKAITTGSYNTALGGSAGENITGGEYHFALGRSALAGTTGGTGCIAIGASALRYGQHNQSVGLGTSALIGNNAGGTNEQYNVAIGDHSMEIIETGEGNTCIGFYTGNDIKDGDYNVLIGFNVGKTQGDFSNTLMIDNADTANPLIKGIFNTTIASRTFTINAATVTFNAGTDTDLVFNFTGTTNSGVLTWMEDEDYFKFSDDILMNSTENIYFRDTAISINSADDGHLDLTADTSIDHNTPITIMNAIAGKAVYSPASPYTLPDDVMSVFGSGDVILPVNTTNGRIVAIKAADTGSIDVYVGEILSFYVGGGCSLILQNFPTGGWTIIADYALMI